jgi:sporulation protein YlmC with PRC-barrel domain
MKFRDGAEVYSKENEHVGRLDRVVLDPITKQVSHIVVRKGILLTEDRVISMDTIDRVDDEKVYLKEGISEFGRIPKFEETHYLRAEDIEKMRNGSSQLARPLYWYPALGNPIHNHRLFAPPMPMYIAETQRNIPDDAVPLKEGAKVISQDGKHVGNIEEVMIDPDEERATHVVIEAGLIFPEKKLIPALWLTNVLEDEVHLAMTSRALERVPDYQE